MPFVEIRLSVATDISYALLHDFYKENYSRFIPDELGFLHMRIYRFLRYSLVTHRGFYSDYQEFNAHSF